MAVVNQTAETTPSLYPRTRVYTLKIVAFNISGGTGGEFIRPDCDAHVCNSSSVRK